VKQDPDPSRNIYSDATPETSPNGLTGIFVVRRSHRNWHFGSKMDNGQNPPVFNETPVYSDPEGGGAAAWRDFIPGGGPNVTTSTNGRAFLRWLRALMDSHFKWRDTFHVGAVAGAAPGSPARPEYLKGAPDINSAERSRIYGCVRLGEFQN